MLLHDVSDPFMEAAKVCLYANLKGLANILFAAFAACFMISRDFIYPIYVISPLFYVEAMDHLPTGHYYTAALCIIEMLNLFWSSLIIKMILKQFMSGHIQDDIREPSQS